MRCDDPPILARGRTDCPRHAAGRGLRGLAAARRSSASMPGGGGSRHQAIRQEPHRAHAPSRPRPLAQRRLPLGPRRRAARPEKPSEIRGPSRPRPRSWPRAPISRRSPHRRGLRHAQERDAVRPRPPARPAAARPWVGLDQALPASGGALARGPPVSGRLLLRVSGPNQRRLAPGPAEDLQTRLVASRKRTPSAPSPRGSPEAGSRRRTLGQLVLLNSWEKAWSLSASFTLQAARLASRLIWVALRFVSSVL